jgi:hypothetical protein
MFSSDGFLTEKSSSSNPNQTHVFTSFPNSAVDPDDENAEQRLTNPSNSDGYSLPLPATANETKSEQPPAWQIEYYQKYFQVDTRQVIERLINSITPRPNKSYFNSAMKQNPDLYGPFWVCATFIITVAISGNIVNYFHLPDVEFQIDFSKITLSAIVSHELIFHKIFFSFLSSACLSLLVVNANINLSFLSLAVKSY